MPDECDPDFDGDGIPDACDADIDGDGVPNECDVDFAVEQPHPNAIYWDPAEGGNGHWYARFDEPQLTWFEARDRALSLGGYLVTVVSEQEEEFRNRLFVDGVQNVPWIGAYKPSQGAGWTWVTGEPWGYTNWALDEPNNSGELAIMGVLETALGATGMTTTL